MKLGGIDDANQLGVAQHIIENYYPEKILKLLLPVDITTKLVSDNEWERKEAQETMTQMGVT